MSNFNIEKLVKHLVREPHERPWLEFKVNKDEPQMIGEDISALANAAAYCDRSHAYLIWGVNNDTHEIVGTAFNPHTKKIGNQDLEIWLRTQVSENGEYEFVCDEVEHKPVVVLIISRAVDIQ